LLVIYLNPRGPFLNLEIAEAPLRPGDWTVRNAPSGGIVVCGAYHMHSFPLQQLCPHRMIFFLRVVDPELVLSGSYESRGPVRSCVTLTYPLEYFFPDCISYEREADRTIDLSDHPFHFRPRRSDFQVQFRTL
jgi:hypothetical protein